MSLREFSNSQIERIDVAAAAYGRDGPFPKQKHVSGWLPNSSCRTTATWRSSADGAGATSGCPSTPGIRVHSSGQPRAWNSQPVRAMTSARSGADAPRSSSRPCSRAAAVECVVGDGP